MSQSATRDPAAPQSSTAKSASKSPASPGVVPDVLKLSIAGMTCGHCVSSVRKALEALPGATVHHVEIGGASVSLKPGTTSTSALVEAIREAGYQASIGPLVASTAKAGLPQAPTGACCCSAR